MEFDTILLCRNAHYNSASTSNPSSSLAIILTANWFTHSTPFCLQTTRKRVFCNFDGCYSKRNGLVADQSDPDNRQFVDDPLSVLLLRRLEEDSSAVSRRRRRRRSDGILTRGFDDVGLEVPDSDEVRRNQWTDTCCSRAALAKIRR